MLVSDIISIVLLAVLLFWSIYNGSIIYVGIRNKRKESTFQNTVTTLPSFSIIVPTKNEELVVGRCLQGIMDIDYPKDKIEIVIVDGNSRDKTIQVCNEFSKKYPNIKVIAEEESHGKPAALNLALSHTTMEIVGIFDADSLPDRNVLNKAAAYFEDNKIMAIQGRTTSINEKSNALTRVIAMEEKAWFQMLLSGREQLQLFVPLNGSCQFVKRTVLDELNGWDEGSLTEDVELALRLVEKDHVIKYAPDVCSGQETPDNLGNLTKQRIRWYRGYMETALKYGRLLNKVNKRRVDAEVSLAGPFMMVVSLLSYINWFVVVVFLTQSNPVVNFTGLVIALTAVSLVSIGIALAASEKPIKLRNIGWIPFIYVYWLTQMFVAGWAFLRLIFRRKRVWTKTAKIGSATQTGIIQNGTMKQINA
jgi:cellulose synthase/poly-beta-1,6-N-acetylglucosamine synthase-like glycosyltransferase